MEFKAPKPKVETTTKNIAGFNMVIRDLYDPDHKVYWDEKISKEMILEDCYQLRSLQERDREIKTIIDIGGHIGSFDVVANVLWPQAQIKAFEPLPENFELLNANTEHIRNKVSIFNMAVAGIAAKQVKFLSPSLNFKQNKKLNTGDAKLDVTGDILTETTTLSEVMGMRYCDLLKMDCEESELEILAEACRKERLKLIRHIRMEIHSEPYFNAIRELLKATHKMEVMSKIGDQLFIVKADLI